MITYNSPNCRPHARCRQDRTCRTCARIRQARIADRAQSLFDPDHPSFLTVLRAGPDTAASLAELRRRFLRTKTPGPYLWTVEQGTLTGLLHLNIIHTDPNPKPDPRATIHHEQIRTSPRIVAAYISKQSQRPDPNSYGAETYGAGGNVLDWLTHKGESAIVQATASALWIETLATHRPDTNRENCSPEIRAAAIAKCLAIVHRTCPNQTFIKPQHNALHVTHLGDTLGASLKKEPGQYRNNLTKWNLKQSSTHVFPPQNKTTAHNSAQSAISWRDRSTTLTSTYSSNAPAQLHGASASFRRYSHATWRPPYS